MFDLLSDSYRPWADVADEEPDPNFWGPLVDDLASSRGRCLIGWDHQPGDGPEHLYHFSLIRWVAIQVGRRMKRFRPEGDLQHAVPYWVEDGVRARPICVDDEWEVEPPTLLYDRYGVPVGNHAIEELAWHFIPDEAHSIISATHHGKSVRQIQQALVHAGKPGALQALRLIRGQIAKLDVLWSEYEPS